MSKAIALVYHEFVQNMKAIALVVYLMYCGGNSSQFMENAWPLTFSLTRNGSQEYLSGCLQKLKAIVSRNWWQQLFRRFY